ncbi:MAG: choice-of-anchor L domain-containing protein, partial [Flavobacteriales bacterium]|nr:choice-of-anchor L domain-containing protein [Flavobacteriales bacterium]
MSKPTMNAQRSSVTAGRTFLGLATALLAVATNAQLTVSPQNDLSALAAAITGPGVTISNPVINCHGEGYGEFAYTGSILGLDEGVLLTSGRINETIGPNIVENKTFNQGTGGNALLNVVTGRTTYDACLFEFDIVPSGDSLRFNFVLGSEEYNEWVGSQYNDVFGFFISGPGIVGDAGIGNDHNIAIVPGTSSPVTINNVNNGSHSEFYYDNAGGQDIQYDGLTHGLYAQSVVQPCRTYHLKLVVADASDRMFDSGVFIERIRSNQVVMTSHTVNGTPHMVEGCNPGWVTFTRPTPLPTPLNLTYYLQGTATNGTDYTAIGNVNPNVPKTVTIPANQTSVNVNVNPQADASSEPTENLLFILGNPFCPTVSLDTLQFNINDTLIATVSPASGFICRGDSVQFHISGGAEYAWTPAASLSSATSGDPWAKPTTNTTYTLTVNEGTCSRTFTRLVRVSDPQLNAVTTRPLCDGASNGAINLTVTSGSQPYSYAWSGPNGFSAATEDLVNIPAGTYTVTVLDNIGCTRTRSFNVGSPAALNGTVAPSILPFGENIACHGASTGTLGLTINGGTAPYATSWTGPNGFTSVSKDLSGLAAGTYSVNITDANGCTFSTAYTMTQPSAIAPSISGVSNVPCFGNNIGQATVNAAGGVPPLTYSWNSSPVQSSATATSLAPGSYTVTVRDGYNCTSTAVATITGPAAALATSISAQNNVNCFGASTGTATVNATGGTAPYAYSWNTTPAQN